MLFKFLSDLSVTDEIKKTSAEIGLAGHGIEKAFPVVHLALGVEPVHIRKSAANVVYRLFQAEANEGREKLLGRLKDEFKFPNKTLHIGIVQSFVKIEPLLTAAQRAEVITFLQSKVMPVEACSYPEGREMALEAAQFMGSSRADGIPYLLAIVNVVRCGNAWLQAVINLENMAPQLSSQKRLELRKQIGKLKQEVLFCLPQNISEPELTMGIGFSRFLEAPKVVIEFEDFRRHLEKEFDRLLLELDKPS
jgi:hypothetical protein